MNQDPRIERLAELRREIAALRGEDPDAAAAKVYAIGVQVRAERAGDVLFFKPQAE